MGPISEKIVYASEFKEKVFKHDVVGFIWGEEMFDCKIHIYPHKLSSIPEYTEVYDDLIRVGMVYLNNKKENPVQIILIHLNEKTGTDIYIHEDTINSCWKYLRSSVEVGMRLCKENDIEIDIEEPEDILDLRLLEKKGRPPFVDKESYEIKYLPREMSDDVIQDQKRKQSALDNPDNRYFFGRNLLYYHDRTCDEIKTIAPKQFMASETIPQDYLPCVKCRRMMLLRKACEPYVKQIPEVDALLRKARIDNLLLEKYVMKWGLWFHVYTDGELTVKCAEDTWIIKGFNSRKYSLWHNNYVKTAPRERYITSGFHEQKFKKKKRPQDMFSYISGYTFDVHLAGEDRKIEAAAKMEQARLREEERMRNPLYRFIKRIKEKIFCSGLKGEKRYEKSDSTCDGSNSCDYSRQDMEKKA